jgi:hypothetical protein
MDNYYENCPPKMNDGRFLENFKSDTCVNEYIKFTNGITRDDDYRLFLQINADKIMDSEWLYLKKNNSCWNNACIHQYPLRMDPRLFNEEREKADALFVKKELTDNFKCEKFADYRMSETNIQKYNINNKTCNSKNCKK